MEIIVVILFAVISMLFNKLGNKRDENPNQQRPIPKKPQMAIPKRLEDVAKEFFEEFQEPERRASEPVRKLPMKNTARHSGNARNRETTQEVTRTDLPVTEPTTKHGGAIRSSHRKNKMNEEKEPALFPKNNKEFLQAFIFSEVIGPPKSKR